jgi:hypothetical protein
MSTSSVTVTRCTRLRAEPKGSLENNMPIWTLMHAVRLLVQNYQTYKYSCDLTSCGTGASTPNITNLFFREP